MSLLVPILVLVALALGVGWYIIRQITHEPDERFGQTGNITEGEVQSSLLPPKSLLLHGNHQKEQKTETEIDSDLLKVLNDPELATSQSKPPSRAKKLIGGKKDLKRAMLVRWLLDRKS